MRAMHINELLLFLFPQNSRSLRQERICQQMDIGRSYECRGTRSMTLLQPKPKIAVIQYNK